ncbi:MobF family relaxase [Kribbella sp. CA-253562]|uniref:MobF family relaxase n=1 Tax=Kribbella sp. CA-253562 TaxID=3239942 RepID=UPI003D8CBA7E
MLSIHRLSAGDGYKYLLKHIAAADVDRRMATPLTAYYVADGYPPGRWLGAGLPGLADGQLKRGDEVTEEQMAALFGRAQDPVTGQQLGRPFRVYRSLEERVAKRVESLDPTLSADQREAAIDEIRRAESREKPRQAVAGFDITFSPAKSVSALWATADIGTKEQVATAHYEAVEDVLAIVEQQAAFSRIGDGGIAQIDVRGVIGAAFDHWDTRSGDPQLHTHLVVANRVQGTDGKWRTLDGRVLFRAAVALSEIHNVLLADNLTRRLGVGWDLRDRGERRNPAFEITGVPDELIREFSSRSDQIESNLAALLAHRNQPPTRREMYVLRQQATLMNRPPKHLAQPLSVLMTHWRTRADNALGDDARAVLAKCLEQSSERILTSADLSAETLDAYGATVVLALQSKRATWNRWNIIAEAARQTRLLRLATTEGRMTVLHAIADRAEQHSISLTPGDLVNLPGERLDGESVYRIHNGRIFTSPVVLGAESLLLDLAKDLTGPTIAPTALVPSPGLSPDRQQVLHRIATSGQRLEALVGPAGTGKTTLLAELRTSWEQTHGPGSVVGVAPSSAASEVLSDSLGITTDNLAKWIHEAVGLGAEQRQRRIAHLERAAALAAKLKRKRRQQRLLGDLAAIRADADRWRLRENQLVIIDEASMAGTMELATLARETAKAGAKLLLVGDDAQLGAIETGGAFRLIAKETQAAQLTEVWRFNHTWEREASLALRNGDESVIDIYQAHDRLTSGTPDECETKAYTAWLNDVRAGLTSLLIAADNATVTRLNNRARLDRILTGEVEPNGTPLHDGTQAGIGDHIVTRLNNRHLTYGPNQFVRNGNQWTVLRRWDDGSLTIQNADQNTITLPAGYVANSVELAYATTAHRAQGSTVDTAHLIVTERMTRPLLYVGMTRGRETNKAYVATHEPDGDLHEPHITRTMDEVLHDVLEQDTTERSAHEIMQSELENATRLDYLVPIHEHLCQVAAGQKYRTTIDTSGLDPADRAAVRASSAYGPLLAALRRAEAAGLDPDVTLRRVVERPSLANARDIAAVLHARVERVVLRAERRLGRPLDRVAGLVQPSTAITDPTFVAPLRELESLITQRSVWLTERARELAPPWYQTITEQLVDRPQAERTTIVRDIAAYRERYDIRSPDPLGPRPASHQLEQTLLRSRLLKTIRPEGEPRHIDSSLVPPHPTP